MTNLMYLQKQWRIVSILCAGSVFVGYLGLRVVWQPEYAQRGLWQAMLVMTYVLSTLYRELPLNYRKGETALLLTFGPGTCMTILRGIFISMLAGFCLFPWPGKSAGARYLQWLPGMLYILAACADYLDGYLARITNHATRLGEVFDTKIDALGLFVAPAVAISFRQLPMYYFIVSMAYYLFNIGRWLRKHYGKPVIEVHPWPGSRFLAGVHMGFVGIVLLPVLTPPATTIAAIVLMLPLLAGFIRDWLITCGIIQQDSQIWKQQEQQIKIFLTAYAPLPVRAMIGYLLFVTLWGNILASLPSSFLWHKESIVITALMLMFGVMGRFTALGSSLLIATIMPLNAPGVLCILLACTVSLMLTGTGRFSIWQPEERFLFERAGERKHEGIGNT
jgi:CDP-diacylglycerol--glycerol-3-phosphate 3-phosphatidyltransferase